MSKIVVGIFNSHKSAEKAANMVKDAGLRTSDISILAKDTNQQNTSAGSQTAPNMTMGRGGINDNISDGVITGGVLGGLAGLLIGAGTMVVPGLGIIAAAGPISGLLSGAVTGGIVGGLVDLGIPENQSKQYESEIKQGKILWSMRTDDKDVGEIESILKSCGANEVSTY